MNHKPHSHHKQFRGSPEFLESPQRLQMMDIPRVLALTLEGIHARSALDVGAGSGLFARTLAAQGLRVAGVDLSPRMLAYASSKAPHIPFLQARMEALPFAANAFDLIFLGHVLHETDDLTHTLTELKRCARLRIVALEWPYLEEPAGPPLHHRLAPDLVAQTARSLGFAQVDILPLERMVLYRLTL